VVGIEAANALPTNGSRIDQDALWYGIFGSLVASDKE
jgi:hypothetical protein